MKDDGIDLFSKEGLSFLALGAGMIFLFLMLNKAATPVQRGPSGTIGVRG